jgi:hypothetical protein
MTGRRFVDAGHDTLLRAGRARYCVLLKLSRTAASANAVIAVATRAPYCGSAALLTQARPRRESTPITTETTRVAKSRIFCCATASLATGLEHFAFGRLVGDYSEALEQDPLHDANLEPTDAPPPPAGAGLGLIAASFILRATGAHTLGCRRPFQLGVASGSRSPTGLCFGPASRLSLCRPIRGRRAGCTAATCVRYENPAVSDIVRQGEATAERAYAYRCMWMCGVCSPGGPIAIYRFTSGDASSRIGRPATLPPADAAPERVRFAFASCANYEHGYFSAYRRLAPENPEFVLFLGDYI